MITPVEIYGGISALKSALDMAKAFKDMDNAVTRNMAVIELSEKIIAAQIEQTALIESKRQLETRVRELESWEADKQRYELKPIGHSAALAYLLKPGMENGETPHELCAACYNNDYKSVLQTEHWQPLRCEVRVCHDCAAVLYVKGSPHPDHKALRPKGYRGPV